MRIISKEEQTRLRARGAEIKMKADPPIKGDNMVEVVTQLSEIAVANKQMASRQKESLKNNLDQLTTVLEKKNIDMTPLVSLLGDIRENTREIPRQAYRFVMHRKSSNQLLDYVDAVPITVPVNQGS